MTRERPRLGLHTEGERAGALKMAQEIHREARIAILEKQDPTEAFYFSMGFLEAIASLANVEGALRLVGQVTDLSDDLRLLFNGKHRA